MPEASETLPDVPCGYLLGSPSASRWRQSAQLTFYVIQEARMPGMDLSSTPIYLVRNELFVILEIVNLLDHFLEACIIDLGNDYKGTGLTTGNFVRCLEDINGLNNFTCFLDGK